MCDYKCCQYCKYGVNIPVDRKTMCPAEGIMPQEAICSRFVFDPFKMHIKRHRGIDFSKFEKEDYSIE